MEDGSKERKELKVSTDHKGECDGFESSVVMV